MSDEVFALQPKECRRCSVMKKRLDFPDAGRSGNICKACESARIKARRIKDPMPQHSYYNRRNRENDKLEKLKGAVSSK